MKLFYSFLPAATALFLFACQPDVGLETDPCESLICLNDGRCENGACICPEGYGSEDCSEPLRPIQMTVHKITVHEFPALQPASQGQPALPWDSSNGLEPDCYVTLNPGTVPVNNHYQSELLLDCTTTPFSYTTDLPLSTTTAEYNSDWVVGIWDNDGTTSELMSQTTFRPSNHGAVTTYSIGIARNSFSVSLDVSWNFEN